VQVPLEGTKLRVLVEGTKLRVLVEGTLLSNRDRCQASPHVPVVGQYRYRMRGAVPVVDCKALKQMKIKGIEN
jgi:hypothetical protein